VNVSRGNNYTVAWAAFGWANIDSYLHMLSKSKNPKEVEINVNKNEGKMRMYQWLGAISTLTPIIVNQLKGLVKFPQEGEQGSFKMKNTYTMAISNDGDQWFFGSKRYDPYQTNSVDVDLTETTLAQIKVKLRQFNGTTPLMKHLNEDIKRLEQLKRTKEKQLKMQKAKLEKQAKEDAFINRLKGICFLCYDGFKDVSDLNIPNAISPNGDGVNDYWELNFTNKYPNLEVSIFDSGSLILYDDKGYKKPWGKNVKNGTYNYMINLQHSDYPEPIFGTITVVAYESSQDSEDIIDE
jgi:gliding motility-associated-like protein